MLAIDTSKVEAYATWLDAQAARLELEVRQIYRGWAIAIHKEITELSPQWSGNLAANWMLDIGSLTSEASYIHGPAYDQPIEEGTRGGGRVPLSRGMEPAVGISLARAKAAGLPMLSQEVFIHNPVAYADSVEQDTSRPPIRAINRVPRSETGKIAMVEYAYVKYSQQSHVAKMSFEAARADMVATAQTALAAWVGPPTPLLLSFQNQAIVDPGAQFDPYLAVDFHIISGEQLSLGATKVVANYGQIHLVAHTRENDGTLLGLKILDHFRPYFQLRIFSCIRTHAARGAASYSKDGWECWPLIVPFWYHELVT